MKTQKVLSVLVICQLFMGLPVVKAETAPRVAPSMRELLKTLQRPDAVQTLEQISPEQLNWPQLLIKFDHSTERVTPLMWAAHMGREDLVLALLAKGARPEIMTGNGTTAALLATYGGHVQIVKTLVKAGASLEARSNSGAGLMNGAASSGKLELIDWLLEQGVPVSAPEQSRFSPLQEAIWTHQFAAIKKLWPLTPDKSDPEEGSDALLAAARQGNLAMLDWLLSQGVALEIRSHGGLTALHEAAGAGQFEVVKTLIERGLAPNSRDFSNRTLLMHAVGSGHLELVKWLVETQQQDVNAVSLKGWTALTLADGEAYAEIVRYLISRGAEPLTSTDSNQNILMFAAEKGELELVHWLRQQARFNLEQRNQDGLAALQLAVKYGHLELARYLVAAGANPRTKNKSQQNLLFLAAASGNLPLAQWLQEQFRFDLRQTDAYGKDVLDNACFYNHTELLFWLVEQGGDLQGGGEFGQGSLLKRAAQRGFRELTLRLWRSGAYDSADLSLAAEAALRVGELELFDELMALGGRLDLMKEPLLESAVWGGHIALVSDLLERGLGSDALIKDKGSRLILPFQTVSLEIFNLLLKQHPELFKQPLDRGQTALHIAAESNQQVLAEWLIEQVGVNPTLVDEDGRNALDQALHEGNLRMVRYLLAQGLSFSPDPETGRNPLMVAASSGNLPLVKLIHQQLKLPLDLRDKGGDTVLSLAVANGHQTVSAWLIDAGAPVTGYNNQGYTLVHQAFASKNPDLVRELLDERQLRLDPSEIPEYWQLATQFYVEDLWMRQALARLGQPRGEAALLALVNLGLTDDLSRMLADPQTELSRESRQKAFNQAVYFNQPEAVKLLYQPGLFDSGQNTALYAALDNHNLELAEYLLEQGIGDFEITSDYGTQSVFEPVIRSGNIDWLKQLMAKGLNLLDPPGVNTWLVIAAENNQLKMVEFLLKQGHLPVDPASTTGPSALMAALGRGHLSMAEYLLAQGADPLRISETSDKGTLHSALESGRPKVLEDFAKRSQQPIDQTFFGKPTLMHYAAKYGHPGQITWLQAKGLALDAQDEEGLTPLMLSVQGGDGPVTRRLLRLGAKADAIDACGRGVIAHAIGNGMTPQFVTFLREQGAPLTGQDCEEQTLVERFNQSLPYLNLSDSDRQQILKLLEPSSLN